MESGGSPRLDSRPGLRPAGVTFFRGNDFARNVTKATDSLIRSPGSHVAAYAYSRKRYLTNVHTAEKPSRQVIFLPSEKLRPE